MIMLKGYRHQEDMECKEYAKFVSNIEMGDYI